MRRVQFLLMKGKTLNYKLIIIIKTRLIKQLFFLFLCKSAIISAGTAIIKMFDYHHYLKFNLENNDYDLNLGIIFLHFFLFLCII